MTEGAAHGANGRGDMRLEAERGRQGYGLPTWFPEDSGMEPEPRAPERLTNWHPPSPRIAKHRRLSREYADETGEAFEPARRPRPSRRRAAPLHHIARAAAAGVLSVMVGALSALVVYDITSGGSVRAALGAMFTGTPLPAGKKSSDTTIAKKNVVTAKLDAVDVVGSADVPIPLSLKAEPGEPDQPIALKLSGIPRDAYLTAGTKLDAGEWLLKPGQEMGVKLVVPQASPLPLSLAVAAIEPKSGELMAPVREFKVAVAPGPDTDLTIEPANAPPEPRGDFAVKPAPQPEPETRIVPVAAHPQAAPIPDPAGPAAIMIERGDALMAAGEFVAARAFYSRALAEGDKRAAFKLAQTYDPEIFAQHQVRGLRPDAARALAYYQQAAAGGITEAQAAIGRLGKQ
jgi:hypothetical protein